jgi:c-di-GMP-binding flagellar brake protein YcgR
MADRRRYPRVQADVFCRPSGAAIFHHQRNTKDISLGGARVFSDQPFKQGSRLDLDVVLPDGSTVRCWAEVVWIVELDAGAPAHYDIGLSFSDMDPADIQRLASVLIRVP